MKSKSYNLSGLLESSGDMKYIIKTPRLQRLAWDSSDSRIIKDSFDTTKSACCFIRFVAGKARVITLSTTGEYRVDSCPAGGWLLTPAEKEKDTYWIPQPPILRQIDGQGHVLSEQRPEISEFNATSRSLSVNINIAENKQLDLVIWRIPPNETDLISSLSSLSNSESQPIFLWGSHTTYQKQADVYLHLIHGHIYENRFVWPFNYKICSEHDAHALFVTLSGFEKATGKKIYSLLKEQLILSVIARQGEDGGWRHGEWTKNMESHYRFQCSGMHMLMDSLCEKDDEFIREALKKAATFIAGKRSSIKSGVWFLHDDTEHSIESLKQIPFKWVPSKALGKSKSNTLVLNTHLDTLIALDRYGAITGDKQYSEIITSARAAAKTVLELHPADWLYRPLFRAIGLTLLPTEVAKKLPLPVRAIKRLAWKCFIPWLYIIKSMFPRIVMPGGYIDRALSLKGLADDYHSVNLMDIARYKRRFPDDINDEMIENAVNFVEKNNILEYWAAQKGRKYALGFWAEALYHLNTLYPDAKYRGMLDRTVADLEDIGLGKPPSLLGANAEARVFKGAAK